MKPNDWNNRGRFYAMLGWYLLVLGLMGFVWGFRSCAARADTGFEAAQVCYSEAGPRNHRECAAILESLRARALLLGRPFRVHMHLYSRGVFDRTRRDSRRWLAFLRPDLSEPAEWPSRASWGNHAPAFGRLVSFVRGWIRRPWNPCEGVPQDWGVRSAVRRYHISFPQAVTLDCQLGPGRHNVFLRRYPDSDETDPDDPHNQPDSHPKERRPVPRVSLGFGSRGACRRGPNLSDKDLDRLP